MAGFLYRGILLQQLKEPALSRDLREFVNADTIGARLETPPVKDLEELTSGELISIARAAEIVDERDGKLLADKLLRAYRRHPKLLVADAIDDEPYISSQINPLLKNQQLASTGLMLCKRACGADDAIFAVYKNLTDLEIRIPRRIGDFDVERIRGRYPAEYQASQHYDEDEGVLLVGAGALLHLARAVLFNRPQTTTFITVAGNCVGNPTNLEVSLGMTVSQVLERCGLIDDPNRVIIGGSMTGISVIDTDNTLITPSTRAVLAFRQDIKTENFQCIGCSRCVHVCPVGINPFYLYRNILYQRFAMFDAFDGQLCVDCGTCSYMCPAKLNLSDTIYKASHEFAPMVDSMRKNRDTYGRYKKASYEKYLGNYMLGKAIRTHQRDLQRILKTLRRDLKNALKTHKAAEKACDGQLSDARKTLQYQEDTAKRVLNTALSSLHNAQDAAERELLDSLNAKRASERGIEQELSEALAAMHNAEKAAERTLSEAMSEMKRTENEADQALANALKAMNTAQAEADKAYQNVCKMRESDDRAADKMVTDAQKQRAQAEKEAEKRFAETEKAQEQQKQRTIEEAEKELAQMQKDSVSFSAQEIKAKQQSVKAIRASAEKLCKEACMKAREALEREKANAKNVYNNAVAAGERQKNASVKNVQSALVSCSKAKEQSKIEYAKAQKECQAVKENAKLVYKQEEQKCAKSKLAARALYEQAEIACSQKKQEAKKVHEKSEAVCAQRKESDGEIYTHAEADFAHACTQAQTVFAVRQKEIEALRIQAQIEYEKNCQLARVAADAARQEIDRTLRQARTEAFLTARAEAIAKAAMFGRRPSLQDFDMPSYVMESEEALQSPAARLRDSEEEEEASEQIREQSLLSSESAVVLEIQELLKEWPSRITYSGQTVRVAASGGHRL